MKYIFAIATLLTLAVGLFGMDSEKRDLFTKSMGVTYDLVQTVDPKLGNVTKQWQKYFADEEERRNKKTPVFVYFFTLGADSSIENTSLSYFNATASKLKKLHSEIRFFGVLRGFPEDKQHMAKVFFAEAKKGDATKAGVKIKFIPTLFEDLNITRAPAYAFAMCEQDSDLVSGCSYKYLARGAIGLDGFLDLIADDNKSFKGWASDARSAQ